MDSVSLTLVTVAPCAAYCILLLTHALTTWWRRKVERRSIILLDLATIVAYGVLAFFSGNLHPLGAIV